MNNHSERAHSKFSASGAERWFKCSASVAASEGQPDKNTEWSIEGTLAHEVLEKLTRCKLNGNKVLDGYELIELLKVKKVPKEMFQHTSAASNFILHVGQKAESKVLVETRVYLDFIHPEAFGTFDGAVLEHFGTLHVFDFKYGMTMVSPVENLQMIFYALGLAHKYQWNFERVRLWIIQPRIKGYDGPAFWDISMEDLRSYIPKFKEAVWRVENEPQFKEGAHCHWCKAKSVCPLKQEKRVETAKEIFKPVTEGYLNARSKGAPKVSEEKFNQKESAGRRKEKSKKESQRLAKKGWQKIEDESFY